MRIITTKILLIFVLAVLALANNVNAQDQAVFASVPEPQRARLVEKLKLVVDYEQTSQWEKLYDLLSPLALNGQSKEKFVSRQHELDQTPPEFKLLDFTPQVFTSDGGGYGDGLIEGCATYREKGQIKKYLALVELQKKKDNWLFSQVLSVSALDSQPQPCVSQPKRAQGKGKLSSTEKSRRKAKTRRR